jgi:hypothetical protein
MNVFQMDYYKTYYFADICDSVMENTFDYVNTLNGFWGDGRMNKFIKPFQKFSILHIYIEFCIDRLIYESDRDNTDLEIEQLQNKKFWINETLDYHKIEHISIWEWYQTENRESDFVDDLIVEYLQFIEFSDFFDSLKIQMIEETFFILFLNRKFLRAFNLNLSEILKIQESEDFEDSDLRLLSSKFKLLRKNIPSWAKKAVFYRDRGKCTYCNKDLTGIINISNKLHIDHIVSLNEHGFNDVSNLQLLCESCNTSKGSRHNKISKKYEKWY